MPHDVDEYIQYMHAKVQAWKVVFIFCCVALAATLLTIWEVWQR